MISPILTVFGIEQSVTTAVAFSGAKLLRVYNGQESDVLVTITNAANTTIGTFTISSKDTVFIAKNPTDKIACGSACKVVPVGY